MSFDREGPRRSPGYEASYRPAPAYSESREQKPPTLAEVAQHAVDGATRSVGGVGVDLDRLHKAEQDRDPKSWTAVHRGLAQQIADARSAIAKARATLHEGGPDESAKLDAATHQLDQHEEAAKQLTTPPLAYKRISREDQITGASPAEMSLVVRVPKGIKVYRGPVAAQGHGHLGGPQMMQVFIPDIRTTPGVEIISIEPFKPHGRT